MDLATLIPLALKTSILLTVFGLALNATVDDALYLLAPALANRIAKPISLVAAVMLLAGALPIIITA